MQIPAESHCFILMIHWIWALKLLQYHWVFCACSLNGLCKVLNASSISHARSSFPFPIWDKILEMIPLFWQVAVYKWKLFQLFHLSISLKSESPTVAQCEAVIVSVPFCPMRLAFSIWKDPERRREGWINTQTAFCLHHFGFCCHETQRHRHVDGRWGRGEEEGWGSDNFF